MIRTIGTAGIAGILSFASATLAHHSHGNYEIGREIQFQGVVTEFHFANPHVWVFMDVENEYGETERWALEGGGTGSFSRGGMGCHRRGRPPFSRLHPDAGRR